MKTAKTSKRALLCSVLSIALCLSMLIGTTFAWFTDTDSTAVNKIQAGTLDVDLQMKGANDNWVTAVGETLNWVKAADGAGQEILWEPGATYKLPELRVINNGNLALKYKVVISGAKDANAENNKDDLILMNVLDWTYSISGNGGEANAASLDTERHLAAKTTDADVFDTLTIQAKMRETAGNEYQGLAIEGIAITVYATQDTVEYDSVDNQYDKDAEYPTLVATGDDLQAIVSNATAPVNIVLTNSITTNNFVIPADKDVTLDLNGRTVSNAGSHTILNNGHLTLTDSSADKSGQIISLKGNTAALRNGDNAVCVIEGGTISRDGANGNTWHVVENFGKMTFNGGKVVLEHGNGFAITNGWNYFDPGASTTHAVMEINALELDTDSSGIKNCRYGDLTVNDVNVAPPDIGPFPTTILEQP